MAYNILRPVSLLTNQSMATDITSSAVEVRNQDNIGIQLSWSGTPTGDILVEISSNHVQDAEGNITTDGNWVQLPLNPAITASGSSDDAYIDLNQMTAQYIRVKYARTSGDGLLSAIVVGKAI
jgi:hypothetical protein